MEKGFKYFYKDVEPEFSSNMIINGGLVTLSRFPIVEADRLLFEPSVALDRLMAKGVIWTKIELPNKSHIHVFNTHLLAIFNDFSETEYLMNKLRAITQVCQLTEFMQD